MTFTARSASDFETLGEKVVVRPNKRERVTQGSIYRPGTSQEYPRHGEVLAAEPGRVMHNGKRIDMEVKSGDKGIYSEFAGIEVEIEGAEMVVPEDNDISAIIS